MASAARIASDRTFLPFANLKFSLLNADSELNFNNGGNDKIQAIIEHAANGDKSFDDIMNEWNQKWSDAQEAEGIEVTE